MGEDQFNAEDTKKEINNLLWMRLPPNVTLQQAEEMACRICREISEEWDKYEADKAKE